MNDNIDYSFLFNNVFVAASKHNNKRNKTGFILFASGSPPLNSRVKNNETCFVFLFLRYV